ncbi:MAG: aminoacyl-histidine dipeptidase [Ruminococcaceae bacterium]|nr:aminoacyl-histidine dipeptidase [Oscillospiraceae bacterium]
MSYITEGCQPKRVFEIFEDICSIPHGSGNEAGVAKYIENFAKNLGLECYIDKTGNVFVKKAACAGYEHRDCVLLQGHMDMVCEKNPGTEHDFERDGLDLFVEGGLLGAHGTSLGGDNGIAVAMMLAILEGDEHPALECLFTVEEETGLAGAKGFDCSQISAQKMINLDSEQDNTVTAGCAGGVRTEAVFSSVKVDLQSPRDAFEISVGGLAGGHSGADINSGRANALVLLARILQRVFSEQKIWLCDINGGGKDNAIARQGSAVVICEDATLFEKSVLDETAKIKKELCSADSNFEVGLLGCNVSACFKLKDTQRILGFMSLVKTGVLKFSNDIDGLVEYSRNLGIAQTEGGRVIFTLSSRSSVEAQIDYSCRELDMISNLFGAQNRHYSRYPGWEFNANSKLREEYLDEYEKLFGIRPAVEVIHAGLECGIISSKRPGLDIISIGPNMYDIHSPAERLDIASCEKIWKVIKAYLALK